LAESWITMLRDELDPAPALPWRDWLAEHFPDYTTAPFAPRHIRFWDWITALAHGESPRSRVEVWPRGGGKSSSIELGCAYLGAQQRPTRHYVLYVSETQEQANKHVQAIATMLERVGVKRALNEYGASKGWRHAEIRTASGFNVTAFGLDSGMRGVKLDTFRPDLIVFDDVDDRLDTSQTTAKKIDVITTTILPTGAANYTAIVVQNKVAADSIVRRLCDGRADFLHDREPATVEPAVIDLAYEHRIDDEGRPRYVITGGTATWQGQDLATCQRQINSWGISAFIREAQHEVDEAEGGLWDRSKDIDPWRETTVPDLDRIVVAVDPSATATGDEAGIVVAGVSRIWQDRRQPEPHGYVLDDRSLQGPPKAWAEAAVAAYHAFRADALVAESNNGGEMVAVTIGTVAGAPSSKLIHASRGKQTRAEPVHKLYQDGRVHHVGTFAALEREQTTWQLGMPSPNRLDALVFALTDLMIGPDDEITVADRDAVAAYRRMVGAA
jgi:hypothetical protein